MDTSSRPTTPASATTSYTSAAPASRAGMSRGQQIGIGIGVVVVLVGGCAFLYWLSTLGALHVLRDLLIIFLAFESILVFVLLAWLILQVQSLVEYVNTEVKPILGSVQESVTTVQTTTSFLQESVVQPVIRFQSATAGLVQAARTLTGRPGGSTRRRV